MIGSLTVMKPSEIKSRKEKLRLIEDHLRLSHDDLGVERDSIGFVEVVHHPTYILPSLNYVTPRRKTAMVPGKDVGEGVTTLSDYRRKTRVMYIDELFPPFFTKTLNGIGLHLNTTIPLWVIDLTIPPIEINLSERISVNTVVNQQGLDIWSLVWRNASYRVFGTSLEPLQIGKMHPTNHNVHDIILYLNHTPMAVARITIHDKSAHLMARAFVQSTQPLRLQQWLLEITAQTAQKQGCEILFICDKTIQYLQPVTNLPLTQEGSMLCYTDEPNSIHGEGNHDTVEQLVLLT